MANSVINLSAIVGDKPLLKSLTVWGVILYFGVVGVIDQACQQGLMADATCGRLSSIFTTVGGILTVLGLRRAATAPNIE